MKLIVIDMRGGRMDDLISRQAAYNALMTEPLKWDDLSVWERARCHQWMMDVDVIEALPSAQPEPCEDVVSRNAIVQKLNKMDRYVSEELRLCDTDRKFPKNEVFIVDDVYEEIVEKMPSAQSEIIYCKDCVKRNNMGFCTILQNNIHGIATSWYKPEDDDFCSHAERRTR